MQLLTSIASFSHQCVNNLGCIVVWLYMIKHYLTILTQNYMSLDFEKLAKLSYFVFREIPILNIETTVVFLC